MKIKSIAFIVVLFCFTSTMYGQNKPKLTILNDSTELRAMPFESLGSLSIKPEKEIENDIKLIEITYVVGKRALMNFKFKSVKEFNESKIGQKIKNSGSKGGRLRIEISLKSMNDILVKNIPLE